MLLSAMLLMTCLEACFVGISSHKTREIAGDVLGLVLDDPCQPRLLDQCDRTEGVWRFDRDDQSDSIGAATVLTARTAK
jgi:hypothetical protein